MKLVRLAALVAAAAASLAPAGAPTRAAEPAGRRVAASHAQQAPAPKPRLVFFMNPNGMPCQMQDRILRDMGAELTERAELVYYRTTVPAEIARFNEYGIRALPTLVVTDAQGRELRRATPGIQQMPQILKLLQF
jgi:thioredoxin 1